MVQNWLRLNHNKCIYCFVCIYFFWGWCKNIIDDNRVINYNTFNARFFFSLQIQSIDRVFLSLTRCVMCRQQKQRQESTCHKNCIKPSMVEIKLNVSTQYICNDYSVKKKFISLSITNGLTLPNVFWILIPVFIC